MKIINLILLTLLLFSCEDSHSSYRYSAESCKHSPKSNSWDDVKNWNKKCEYDSYGTIDGKKPIESPFTTTPGAHPGFEVAPGFCLDLNTHSMVPCA